MSEGKLVASQGKAERLQETLHFQHCQEGGKRREGVICKCLNNPSRGNKCHLMAKCFLRETAKLTIFCI